MAGSAESLPIAAFLICDGQMPDSKFTVLKSPRSAIWIWTTWSS